MSFNLDANKATALVGPSGAGKTSLINAILGFMPYEGSLKINGVELKSLDQHSWRQAISWVGQNPLLLHGTILDNVTLGNPDVSEARVNDALLASFSAEFVEKHGLNYQITDRSGGLSVGQAQRLALARAMVQNGQFWLLDEPTASLDAKSERLVTQGLHTSTAGKTTLMVTHQLSQLKEVDNILVMNKGQIEQHGDYTLLASNDGLFKTMLSAQQSAKAQDKGNLDA
ncbi:transport ATP-binding protein CydD [Vibrio variabilis]|uniref:Transport ATP-binding protein CydD n=1 Tax=Vibrio variabilis TaxID=990271 RepID=A0ABQ0JPR8_9VIBR|nr:transport ATP-binding protein CydD [Vibrio variabilis]